MTTVHFGILTQPVVRVPQSELHVLSDKPRPLYTEGKNKTGYVFPGRLTVPSLTPTDSYNFSGGHQKPYYAESVVDYGQLREPMQIHTKFHDANHRNGAPVDAMTITIYPNSLSPSEKRNKTWWLTPHVNGVADSIRLQLMADSLSAAAMYLRQQALGMHRDMTFSAR